MARRRFVFVIVTATVLASVLLVPILVAEATGKSSPQFQGQVGVSYASLPATVSTGAGVHLYPLQNSQLTAIQVSAPDAIAIAKARLGLTLVAYVVSFSGLPIAPQSRTSVLNTETNVVVNATTGEIVEKFSYH